MKIEDLRNIDVALLFKHLVYFEQFSRGISRHAFDQIYGRYAYPATNSRQDLCF